MSTPSIKSALSGKAEVKLEEVKEQKVEQTRSVEKLKTPFNQDILNEVWPAFREKFKDEVYLFNAFSINPKYIADNVILFEIDNSVMNDQYRRYMPELIGFFRNNLKNEIFDIKLNIVKKKRNVSALTDEQKLQQMMQKKS